MNLYREENIRKILGALDEDQYSDSIQDENIGKEVIGNKEGAFLSLYLDGCENILELGCGSGDLFSVYPITHAIEPCIKRFAAAEKRGGDKVQVKRCVVEAIDFEDKQFDAAFMINGWFQLRSDYESLIEVNRVLKKNGRFILNLLCNDSIDIVCGRCLGANNYIRLMGQFGFELEARLDLNAGPRFVPPEQMTTYIVVRKVRDFDPRWLSLPQVTSQSHILNYISERDWRLL